MGEGEVSECRDTSPLEPWQDYSTPRPAAGCSNSSKLVFLPPF